MKNTKKFLVLMAVLAIIMAQSSLVYAVDAPPTLPNPFGDAADEADDAPPSLELADEEDDDTDPTPTPTPTPSTQTPVHNAATLTKSGPESYYLLLLLAFSLAGGHLYRLKKERN